MSDFSLQARLRYSLVVEEEFKKPTKQTRKGLKNSVENIWHTDLHDDPQLLVGVNVVTVKEIDNIFMPVEFHDLNLGDDELLFGLIVQVHHLNGNDLFILPARGHTHLARSTDQEITDSTRIKTDQIDCLYEGATLFRLVGILVKE